jgi:hypothetical protein
MNNAPKDDRVFLAPEGYRGELYLMGYAIKSENGWTYKMDVEEKTPEKLAAKQMQILEAGALDIKVLFMFPEVNTKFRDQAATLIRRLNNDKDAVNMPPDIVVLQDIVGKA